MFSIVPFPQPVYHISYSDWARGGGESGTKSLVESQINSPVLDRHLDLNITAHQLDTHTSSSLSDNSSETEETDLTPPQADTSTPPTPLADSETRVIDSAVSSLLPPLTLSASSNQQQKDDKPPPTGTDSRSSLEEIDTLVTSSLILPERIDHFPTTSSLDSGVYSSLPSSEASVTGTMANVGGVAVQSSPLSPRNRKLPKVADSGRGRCPKCKKLVYFAERKVAMGQQWHQKCFRCYTCGRFLDPGRHCEHDGQPYCNTCYNQQFGADGLRTGTSIQPRPHLDPPMSAEEKNDILSRIETYNLYKDQPIEHIKCRETGDRLFFEGVLKLYWGLKRHIVLSSGGANYGRQRARESSYNYVSIDDEGFDKMVTQAPRSGDISGDELQRYMELTQFSLGTDELVKGLNSSSLEAFSNGGSVTDSGVGTITEESDDPKDEYVIVDADDCEDDSISEERACQSLTNSPSRGRGVVLRQKSDIGDRIPRTTSVRRRSASFKKVQKYKRQEAREEKRSKFIPPYGKPTNLRVSNLQRTPEVIDMLLLKYNVENKSSEFSLMVVHDNGAMEQLDPSDSPLSIRLKLGPSEDVAKIYVMEASDSANMQLSQEVAEYIRFQLPELNIFLKKFEEEEEREAERLKRQFDVWKSAIMERKEQQA